VNLARIALDYYATPSSVVEAILPHLPPAASVLDPCCGEGEILALTGAADTLGIELDHGRAMAAMDVVCGLTVGDALAVDWPAAALCLFNPPWGRVQEFAAKAMAWRAQDPRRTVAMLARLTFLESAGRAAFHRTWPSDVFVFSRRPRFRPDTSGTDSVTAAWFVFGPGRGGRWSVL